ncbi:MAG: hypothetical protein BWK78_00915 [Thiotrichaceae bacterium IS1]|nr:MAG: hypothetical protein BWK78_00915 [Thiotrichaceae bacterium IS1]
MNKLLIILVLATAAMCFKYYYYYEVSFSSTAKNAQTGTPVNKSPDSSEKANDFMEEGRRYRESRKLAEAKRAFQKAKDIYAEIGDHFGEANVLVEWGIMSRDFEKSPNWQEALKQFSFASQLYTNSNPSTELETSKAFAFAQIGQTYFKQGESENALERFEQALKINKDIDNWQGQWNNYLSLAEINDSRDQKEKTIDYLNKALLVDEKDKFSTCINNRLADYEKWIVLLHSKQEELVLKFFEHQQSRISTKAFPLKNSENLQEGELLLIYNVMKDKTLLWVVSKVLPLKFLEVYKPPVSKQRPMSAADLQKLVNDFNDSLESSNSKKLKTTGQSLYQILFNSVFSEKSKTAVGKRNGNGKSAMNVSANQNRSQPTLYIVSTGILNQLNFEDLITKPGKNQVPYVINSQKGSENSRACPQK